MAGLKLPEVNYKQDMRQYLGAMQQSMPGLLNLEQKYRDNFQGLNLGDMSNFLGGTGGQDGLYRQGRESMERAGDQIGDARKYDLTRMTGQADEVRDLFQKLAPGAADMIHLANQDARQAQRSAMGLSGQEKRSAEQFAREGAAAGRVGDNSTIAAGILNRDDILSRKRQEAQAATQNAFSMGQSFYQQPGLQMLNQTPQSYQAGQNYLGLGLGAIGAGKPQLVNPDTGLMLGAANQQNQYGLMGAKLQADAAKTAGKYQAGGSILGGLGSLFGGLFS